MPRLNVRKKRINRVKGDDGWLVLDRNGNGLIDSGRELFGVDTLLSGTPGVDATYANTGFEALKTLDSNGNTVSGTATVTRTNGTTTLAETVSVAGDTTAANLFLGVNPFYREFTDTIAPTTQAQNLPNMRGSGWVRDLLPRTHYKVDSCSRNIREVYRHKRRVNACGVQRMSKQGSGELLSPSNLWSRKQVA